MQYIPPLRHPGPSSSYRNADPPNGVRGSVIPAAAVEYTMREIVAAITALGVTPSNSSTQQPSDAIVAALAAKQASHANLTALAGMTLGTFADELLATANAAAVQTLIGLVIGTDVQAYDANTAKLNAVQNWSKPQRSTPEALGNITGTVTLDFAAYENFEGTLTGNITLADPSNLAAGQYGTIRLAQDATGSRTISFGSKWKTAGGVAGTLSTAANAVDALHYYVHSSSVIEYTLAKGIA